MKIIKEVKAQPTHKQKYRIGVVYLPKKWIGKLVEIKETDKRERGGMD